MRQKKILIAHVPYEYSGGEDHHVRLLYKIYIEMGFAVEFIPKDREYKPITFRGAFNSLNLLGNESTTFDGIKAFSPDLIHLHNAFPMLGPRFFSYIIETKIPMIMTVHNHRFYCTNGLATRNRIVCKDCRSHSKEGMASHVSPLPLLRNCNTSLKKSTYHWLAISEMNLNDLYRKAVKKFIAPSPYIENELIKWGAGNNQIMQIFNPVVADLNSKQDGTELTSEKTDVYYAGRLSEEKGIRTLLAVVKLCPDLKFAISGNGPLLDQVLKIKSSVSNLVVYDNDSHDGVLTRIKNTKIGILLSECNEVFPTFALECFLSGKYCVLSAQDSMKWFDLNNGNWLGALANEESYKLNRADAITKKIREAIALPKPSEDMVQNVKKLLSLDAYKIELKKVIDETTR